MNTLIFLFLNLYFFFGDCETRGRLAILVKQNMTPATRLACGIKDVASAQKETFTTTQAVWRFLNNEKISVSKLNQPILGAVVTRCKAMILF